MMNITVMTCCRLFHISMVLHGDERCFEYMCADGLMYGVLFSHLFPELQISPIELQMSAIQL